MARVLYYLKEGILLGTDALDRLILKLLPRGPHPVLAVAGHTPAPQSGAASCPKSPVQDLLGDGFLWAVPKHRRSRERRLIRKFGSEFGHKKMLPYLKLLTCDDCGHPHEPGRLCPNCYTKNKEVTEAMQQAMVSVQGLDPIEHEVLPLFKKEKVKSEDGFFEGKRVVEVPRERPKWFSQRLTTKSNVTTSSETTVIKPSNLA